MFIFAPKNPPPGFGMSSDASGTNGVLPNIDETKEPNGVPTGSGKKEDSSSQDNHVTGDEQKPSTEGDHVAVSMTTEEDEDDIHVYDDVELTLGAGVDTHDEKESENVTIDEQGGAHFKKESHDLDDHDYGEIIDNDNAEVVDNDDTELGENDYLDPLDHGNPEIVDYAEIVDNANPVLRENDYLELVDNGNPEIVDNDNPDLRHNDDSIQNEDVVEDENENALTDQQAGAPVRTGMTDEDNGAFDTRL